MKTKCPPQSLAVSSDARSRIQVEFQKLRTTFIRPVKIGGAGWLMAAMAVSLISPPAARAQIQQINLLPGLPSPTATKPWNQNKTTIYQATNTQAASPNWYATRPHAYGFDVDNGGTTVRKIFLSWLASPDYVPGSNPSVGALHLAWRKLSLDGGKTWGAASTHTVSNAAAMSVVRRRNGHLLALSFRPGEGYFRSTDNAVTWTKYTDGSVTLADGVTPLTMLFHRGIIEENNGDLYAVGYSGWDCVLMKSVNDGVNVPGKKWVLVSRPADGNTDGDNLLYNESTFERCADGSWLVVVREEGFNGTSEMRARRTYDKGLTWTLPYTTTLPGLPTRPNTLHKRDCDPHLKLMPNGVLVLSYGPNIDNTSTMNGNSRNCNIAFAADGIGTSWTNGLTTLTGVTYDPSDSNPPAGLESTGYTEAVPVSAHRFLTVGDTGHTWSYTDDTQLPDNPYSIWGRYVDIVRTQVNRIDLKTKHALGTVTIMPATDLTYTNAQNPEARPTGAFDGSNDYWSGAFKSGSSGTYQLDLQQTYVLNAVGLCMHYNNTQSATVQLSTNGTTWNTVKTYANAANNAANYALSYATFAAQSARYVRVTVAGAGPLVCVNELELYETRDTFENNGIGVTTNAHGLLPPGYAAAGTSATQYGFAVRDSSTASAYQSERCLQMWDSSSEWRAGITKGVGASATKTFEFRIKPIAYSSTNGAIQFMLQSGTSSIFQMAVFPNGSIKYYNGSTWVDTTGTGAPAGANSVPLNTWSVIRVQATITSSTAGTAVISVGGAPKGTAGKIGTATTMNAITFGSGGTGAFNDNALFDDISIN